MKLALSMDALSTVNADLLAIGVVQRGLGKSTAVATADKATRGAIAKTAKDEGFTGKIGESVLVQTLGRMKAARVLLVGLGPNPGERELRTVGVRASVLASRYKSVAVVAHSDSAEHVRLAAEGIAIGAYRFTKYLTGDRIPKGELKTGVVVVSKKADPGVKVGFERAQVLAESIHLVRDLVNRAPNDLTPAALADASAAACKEAGVTCKVMNKAAITKEGMHLLLAVNRGAGPEPRFVHMSYVPPKTDAKAPRPRRIVFVGKGLTFDSGGLCIKPAKAMIDMKCDMTGAAVTLAVIVAAARLKLPVEVHGIIAATENMPGPDAYRPGDVFSSLDGKSVEIINTDAEGRLVLADALAYARRLEPDYVIDHATLTGACMVALGPWTAGLFANDDELAVAYQSAAHATGESYWRLPLNDELRDMLKSDVADLKHTGESYGGAITAALFLREFVGTSKWMHLDIAGPAFGERAHGIYPKGGTGFGVLTAVRFLESLNAE